MSRLLKITNAYFLSLVIILSRQKLLLLLMGFILINCLGQFVILLVLPTGTEHPSTAYPLWKQIVVAGFLGPIIETILFQILLMKLILKTITRIEILAVFLSALLFGLWHSTNATFMAAGCVSGFSLAVLFFVFRMKRQSPLIYLALIHGAFNLFALGINNLILK